MNNMKKMFLFAALTILSVSAALAQPATINGKVKGYSGGPFYAISGRIVDTVDVAGDGTFTIHATVNDDKSQIALYGLGRMVFNLVAGKGQSVQIDIDLSTRGEESVTFSGHNAELNNYLAMYSIQTGSGKWSQERIAGSGSFKAYQTEVNKMVAMLQANLDKIPDKDTREELQQTLDLMQKSFYFRYAWAINRIGKRPVDSDNDFVQFAESIDLNNRRIIDEPREDLSYSSLVDQRLRWEVERNRDRYSKANASINYYAVISDLIKDPDVAGKLATGNFDNYLAMGGDNHLKETLEAFKKVCNNQKTTEKFEIEVKKLEELSPGKMAPDFVLVDAKGNKRMLSDLRGKNIYIDVWATWCGPCVMEIPYIEKLYEKFKENPNFEFVSISVDDDVDAWKKKLATDNPQWKNFVVEGGFRGPMNQLYFISGIPRFMLIDKEGKIVSVNAPRPSSARIEEYLAPYM